MFTEAELDTLIKLVEDSIYTKVDNEVMGCDMMEKLDELYNIRRMLKKESKRLESDKISLVDMDL